jgi:hypothetical protein
MVRIIPFVLDVIPPPEFIIRSNRIQFWLIVFIIAIVAILCGVSKYFFEFYDAQYFQN